MNTALLQQLAGFVLACGLAMGSSTLFAQETLADSTVLPAVYLTSPTLQQQLQQVPAAVQLLDSTELHRGAPVLLSSSFNRTAGVYTQEGALNTSRISIRGVGARAQYGTNRVRAFFGEIPISSADGETILHDLEPDAVETVEIFKGPAAGIYGSGLGGVIHVKPFSPKQGQSAVKLTSDVGSFGMFRNGAGVTYAGEANQLFANYTHTQKDGFRQNADYDRKALTLYGKQTAGSKTDWSFLANYTHLHAHIPSSISQSNFETRPEMADTNWNEAKGYEDYDRLLLGVAHTYRFSESLRQTTSIFTNYRDAYEPRPFDILKQTFFNYGARTRFTWENTFLNLPVKTTLGGETMQEHYQGSTYENRYQEFPGQGSVRGDMLTNASQKRSFINGFLQLDLELSDKLELLGSIHTNQTQYTITDLYVQDGADQSGSHTFPAIWSPRVALHYAVSETAHLYANWSKGFSAPTVEETRTPEGRINTSLQPETGWNYELGYKGNWWQAMQIELALYRMEIDNLLVAQRVAEDRYVGANAGKTTHDGLEATLRYRWKLLEEVEVQPYASASLHRYRFTDFVDEDTDYSGNELTGVPEYTANIGLDATLFSRLTCYSNLLLVGEMPMNDANTVYSQRYSVLNLKLVYSGKISGNWNYRVQAGSGNVLNTKYAASILPNAVGFGGSDPRYFYPGDPVHFFGGITLQYLFGGQ